MNHAFRSTWGALLWKEWRQQRLAFVALAILCLVVYVGGNRSMGGKPEAIALLVLLVVASLVLSVNAFAAGRDDGTESFLSGLPIESGQLLLVRYVTASLLAMLCVMPAFLVRRPVLGEVLQVFDGGLAPLENDLLLPVVPLFLATATVALAGVVTGRGLRGIVALFTAAVVVLAWQFVFVVYAFPLFKEVGGLGRQPWHFYLGICAAWLVVHLWLGHTWLSPHGRGRADWRRTALWMALLLVLPLLPTLPTIAHERLLAGPQEYANSRQPQVRGGLQTTMKLVPSPDGKTIAMSTIRRFGNIPPGATTWLMDVETARIRRAASRWRYSRFLPAAKGWSCWSPDGSQVRLHTTPAVYDTCASEEEAANAAEQWVLQVRQGKGRVVGRSPAPGSFRSHFAKKRAGKAFPHHGWLGDGTEASWTPSGWEFRASAGGPIQLCEFAEGDGPGNRVWGWGIEYWLDHAIVRLAECFPAGQRTWRYWRSAPGMAQVECRDIVLDSLRQPRVLEPLNVSRDGKWLLMGRPDTAEPPLCLVRLADGVNQVLDLPPVGSRRVSFFTPDSARLVFLRARQSLRAWNLAKGHWEKEMELPEAIRLPKIMRHPSYAFSPGHPSRVAIGIDGMVVFVLGIEEHKTTRIKLKAEPEISVQPELSWLGNDRLLIEHPAPYRLWVVEADGSGSRQVLP